MVMDEKKEQKLTTKTRVHVNFVNQSQSSKPINC